MAFSSRATAGTRLIPRIDQRENRRQHTYDERAAVIRPTFYIRLKCQWDSQVMSADRLTECQRSGGWSLFYIDAV